MKTLALNPDKNYQENMADTIDYFCTHAHGEKELTGMFAFKDRGPYMLHFPRWNSKPILPDKLANAIIRWCEKGKGWALIHSRSYPHSCKPRNERMPLKLSDEKYFYHIGGYGSTSLWNEVTRARRVRRPTNLAVYERWIEAQTSEDFVDRWYQHHLLQDEGNERTRSFSSFIWNDGMIEKFNMFEDDYEDNSPARYKVFNLDGHSEDNTLTYRHAFAMQPEWDGIQ